MDWNCQSMFFHPPPVSKFVLKAAHKLVEEHRRFKFPAVALVDALTGERYFRLLSERASAVCFSKGRVPFTTCDGQPAISPHSQALFYFGKSCDKFADATAKTGHWFFNIDLCDPIDGDEDGSELVSPLSQGAFNCRRRFSSFPHADKFTN